LAPSSIADAARKALCGFFNLIFTDECRVCGESLQEVSRIPVCSRCLSEPELLIAEHYCVACRTPFVTPYPLDKSGRCGLCRAGLQGFDAVYSYGSYEGTLRKLIHIYKYNGVEPLAAPFGKFLAQVLPREQTFDVIVPMPLHWRKRWQRGFNQAELLAKEISRRWNVPVERVVRRRRGSVAQAGLSNAQRRKNVAHVFKAAKGKPLEGKRVLLVDDVFTTGATASSCARVLKRAGAAHVTLLALARTDRRAFTQELRGSKAATAATGE
jgi:ComF family protein